MSTKGVKLFIRIQHLYIPSFSFLPTLSVYLPLVSTFSYCMYANIAILYKYLCVVY